MLTVIPQPENDPTLNVDLTKTYDALIVGSGAAGGMASHVLTAAGMKVLMLEAGKKLPIEKELRSGTLAFLGGTIVDDVLVGRRKFQRDPEKSIHLDGINFARINLR